jgi:hypothetical protein
MPVKRVKRNQVIASTTGSDEQQQLVDSKYKVSVPNHRWFPQFSARILHHLHSSHPSNSADDQSLAHLHPVDVFILYHRAGNHVSGLSGNVQTLIIMSDHQMSVGFKKGC